MLRVELIGNLGSDPEQRYTAKGTMVANFRVAVNSVRSGPDGERKERTDWFRIKTSGAKADYVIKALRKGSRVFVVGRLEIDEYQSRDGEPRTSYDVWADDVVNLTPRDEGGSSNGGYAQEPATAGGSRSGQRAAGPAETDTDLEDLPF